jgi:hypothetical protein
VTALALLRKLREQGITFQNGDTLRVAIPTKVVLSKQLAAELSTHTNEIVGRFRHGGVSTADVLEVFPGSRVVTQDRRIKR